MRASRTALRLLGAAGMVLLAAAVLYELLQVRSEIEGLRSQIRALRHEIARPTPTRLITPTRTPAPIRAASQNQVLITVRGLDYAFQPQLVTVKVGGRVRWINRTASLHSVTSDQPRLFDRTARPQQSITIIFHRPGTYHYHCSFHPYQRGVVVVAR